MDNCIVVIIGESRYGVLVRAAQEIAEGFRQFSGIPVVEVDLAEEKNWEVFVDALVSRKIQPKFIFCMQAVVFDVHTTKGNLFFDRFPYPLFGWIFDHPYYHGSRVECLNGGNRILACINQSDTDYIERYFPGKATKLFLPHGGFSSKYAFNLNFRDRIPAVFFSGGYLAVEESLQKIEELHETHQYLVKQWTAKFLKKLGGGGVHHICLQECFQELSLELAPEEEKALIEAFIRIVDTYSRAIVRTSSIQALLEAGIPVAVVGQNWQNFSCRNKELLTILSDKDGVSIDEVLRFMSNFQIVLNISDNYSQGGHERVPTAMLSGCVCISTPSSYFQTKYEDKKEILYYDPQNIASLPSAVHWLWEHPEKAEEIARHGYEKAKKEDTWQIRAQEILEIIQQRK